MESFKIEHFKRDHPDLGFPCYRKLSKLEVNDLCQEILRSHGLPIDTSAWQLPTQIRKRSMIVRETSVLDCRLDLINLLEHRLGLSVSRRDQFYVNWDNFDNVDLFPNCEFFQWLHYIWYPSSDDIEIIPQSKAWILSIDHDGFLYIMQHSAKSASA